MAGSCDAVRGVIGERRRRGRALLHVLNLMCTGSTSAMTLHPYSALRRFVWPFILGRVSRLYALQCECSLPPKIHRCSVLSDYLTGRQHRRTASHYEAC